jgi:hypothetical protein
MHSIVKRLYNKGIERRAQKYSMTACPRQQMSGTPA